MKIIWLQLLILLTASSAALVVPHLSIDQLLLLFTVPIIVSILCGWVLTFQMKAVRKSKNIREGLLFGLLFPIPSNWVKPVPLSWPAQVLLISAAIPAGLTISIIWIVYAYPLRIGFTLGCFFGFYIHFIINESHEPTSEWDVPKNVYARRASSVEISSNVETES